MRAPACTHCHARVGPEEHRCPACHARLGFVPELGMLCAFEDRGEAGWHPLGVPGLGVRLPCGNYGEHPICHWTVPADASDCLCESCRCVVRTPRLVESAERLRWARFGRARRRLFTGLRQLGMLDARGRLPGLPEALFDVVDDASQREAIRANPAGRVLVDLARIDALSDHDLFDALRRALGLRLCLAAGGSMAASAGRAFDVDLAIAGWDACWAALGAGPAVAPREWRGATAPDPAAGRRQPPGAFA
ncbi:MAG: zinc-ribbon domain-containing protein [Burkholderiaceae bacterium]